MTKRSAVLAAAAAAIFVSGATSEAFAGHHEGDNEQVKCEGVNSCKGQSECNTDHSACHGQNECSGKGWVKMTAEECDKAKEAMAKEAMAEDAK